MRNISKACAALAFMLFSIASQLTVKADNFSFTGNFNQDDDVQLFNFSLNSLSTVKLSTSSFSKGGFDTILTLFNSSTFIAENDGLNPLLPGDAFLELTLGGGNYTLALTQFDNFALGSTLAEGFERVGEGDFTGPLFGNGSGRFIDVTGSQRTSAWQVNIDNVNRASSVPEPASIILLGTGMAGIAATLRRRKSK